MTAVYPQSTDLRDCHLYRFWVYHPDDMHLPPADRREVLGYIGETVRMAFVRMMEHVYDQPWADTIVRWEVDRILYPGKTAVVAAERAAVENERPLYNYEHNLANPVRVEIWRAKEQRWTRDRAAGRVLWAPSARTVRDQAPRQKAESRRTAVGWWTPARLKATAWLAGWASTAGFLWWSTSDLQIMRAASFWQALLFVGGLSAALLTTVRVWVGMDFPFTRRQWRKARRQVWRRWKRKLGLR